MMITMMMMMMITTTITIIIIIIIIIIIRRNRGFSNCNTGPSHTNKKLQEIYFEAAKHR